MKLLKVLFHRVTFAAITIALQLLVLIAVIIRFNQFFPFFYAISLLASIVAVFVIINNKTHPDYKLAWIIPILSFPIFGGLFYFFVGRSKLSKRMRNKMHVIEEKMRASLNKQPQILAWLASLDENAANQSRYIQDYSYCPPYVNTIAEYFPLGEKKFARFIEELRKAEKYIFLEYYIIEEGIMWNSILDILVEKAQQGVDVRVIYDGIGCLFTLPLGYDKRLEKMGIKCCVFNPLIPILSLKLNNRDHRKIAVIDGKVGFTGGINLADEYINEIEKYGHWKDSAVMLKGDAVWSLTVIFLAMWDYLRGVEEDFNQFRPKNQIIDVPQGRGCIQPFSDNPLDDEPVGKTVYLNLINKAKRYIYITTPYLIIDNEMAMSLATAAKSGVDVRIITPSRGDSWVVQRVTRSYYKMLVTNGVKIYEYTPGFMHAKTFTVDDEYGVVGTINMDYRSLFMHFECAVWLYRDNSISTMKEDFLKTLEVCRQITTEDVNNIKWYHSLLYSIFRIFAPLM